MFKISLALWALTSLLPAHARSAASYFFGEDPAAVVAEVVTALNAIPQDGLTPLSSVDLNIVTVRQNAWNAFAFFDSFHLSGAGHALLTQWYLATESPATGKASRAVARLPDISLATVSLVASKRFELGLSCGRSVVGNAGKSDVWRLDTSVRFQVIPIEMCEQCK